MTREAASSTGSETGITLTRVFDAPRHLVWKAWTDPVQFMQWWGPGEFTSPACTIDLRVGGQYIACMRDAEGKDFWSTGFYREIVEPERLVFTDSFSDADGNIVDGATYGIPGVPLELLVTVTLEDIGDGRTRLTLVHAGMPGEHGEMALVGWREAFDKMAAALASAG